MDRTLVLKILQKEYFVKLEDSIYNLRELTEEIRDVITYKPELWDDAKCIGNIQYKLSDSFNVIDSILQQLDDPNALGYTNSRNYLIDYVTKIKLNINDLNSNFSPINDKLIINHNNILMDLILKY